MTHPGSVRILHVLNNPRAEGTPNLVLDWLASGGGYWQAVVCLEADPPDFTERLRFEAAAYEEHRLLAPGGGRVAKWVKFPRIALAAYQAVRNHRPDLVVCWPAGFANWVCLGARLAGCRRLIVHAGNPTARSRRNDWLTRYVNWPLSALGAKVICCSDYVRDTFRAVPGVSPVLFQTVYNCTRAGEVARRAESARGGEVTDAIMVATFEAHKDHATLLRAVPGVAVRRPGFRLRLAGGGTLLAPMKALAEELGVGDRVEFLGTRRDVPELLGQTRLFVFATTTQEGLGSVLLEALAARLPVVASDVPACRELLAGGHYGVLVPPNDPKALADAICNALAAPPPSARLDQAYAYATGFTVDRMMAAYLRAVRLR